MWREQPASAVALVGSVVSFFVAAQLAHASRWLDAGSLIAVLAASAATGVAAAALLGGLAIHLARRRSEPAARRALRRLAVPCLPLLLSWLALVPDASPLAGPAHTLGSPTTILSLSAALGLMAAAAAAAVPWVRLAAPPLAAAVLFVATLLLPRPTHATPLFLALGVAWALYVLAALAGWGTLVARASPGPSLGRWCSRCSP
jgi:hypothetical protein